MKNVPAEGLLALGDGVPYEDHTENEHDRIQRVLHPVGPGR